MWIRTGLIALCLGLTGGCGTYSNLRPADNLKAGQGELQAGLAASSLGEFIPVGKVNYGLTDRIEIGAQYEVYSLLGDVRFGILRSEEDGFALAIGVQAGMGQLTYSVRSLRNSNFHAVVGPNLVLGRRFGRHEVYSGLKALIDVEDTSFHHAVYVSRSGYRHTFRERWILGGEAGLSLRIGYGVPLYIGEGTIFGGLRW